jgi:hypothetical protein
LAWHLKRRMVKNKFKRNKIKNNNTFIPPTVNGRMIYELMKERKVRGRYKDYVIINGTKLMDWLGTYEIKIIGGKNAVFFINSVILVHKSKLSRFIGKEGELKFWSSGMRTNMGVESRRVNCIVSDKGDA